MRYIAHRGLFKGPDKQKENHPAQIMEALERGFDCEVDLYRIVDKLYLGHDEPQYEIDEYWLRDDRLWIHAKNIEALNWLSTYKYWRYHFFWHQEDDYTLTSRGFIWTYPGKKLVSNSVMVMPEHIDLNLAYGFHDCYGICSDYVLDIKEYKK